MASLNNVYFKVETLETLLKTLKQKNEKGISIDISISDETNDYGQNLTAYVSQTKEEREAKKNRFYVGNGKCFWTDGTIKTATKVENIKVNEPQNLGSDNEESYLPF